MIIKINGSAVSQEQDLLEKLKAEIEITKEKMNEMNRDSRRSKTFKYVASIIAVIGTIGITATQNAYAMDASLQAVNMNGPSSSIVMFLAEKILSFEGHSVDRESSFAWRMCKYMTDVMFKTEDFFNSPSILHMWNVVWYIVLSFTTLIAGKKGFDMIKARTLGSNSNQSAVEFIVRLLASLLISFLSLDIMSAGIKLSNIISQVLMDNFAKGIMSFENLQNLSEAYIGSFFWLTGFIILFIILGVRYWIRQLNVIVLGMMTPVASMAWVTDGGAMMGTLLREFITSLTTPLAQALTLGIGTTVLFEVAAHTGDGFVAFMNSMLIGISTMFLMIFTPEFLRKFISGSANPLGYALKLAMQLKGMPARVNKMMG